MRKQVVRIVSVDKRYMKEPYPYVPIFNERIGTYVTGQHIDPRDQRTSGNLTRLEIEDPSKIPAEKMKKFPHVIQAEIRLPLTHLRSFDISVDETGEYINKKDAAEFNFYKIQDNIASSKSKIVPGEHLFYIEDLEDEARVRVSNRKLRYEAENLVREKGGFAKYKDIALILNYKIKDFRVNINASEAILEDKILEACETHPQEVVRCFDADADEDLFILKAEAQGLIARVGNSFFDGSQFLGDNLDEIKKFIRTEAGARYQRRWAQQLGVSQNMPQEASHEELKKQRFDTLIEKSSKLLITGFIEDAVRFYQEAYTLDPKNPVLSQLKSEIDLKMESKPTSETDVESKKEEYIKKLESRDKRALVGTLVGLKVDASTFNGLDDDALRDLIIKTKFGDK